MDLEPTPGDTQIEVHVNRELFILALEDLMRAGIQLDQALIVLERVRQLNQRMGLPQSAPTGTPIADNIQVAQNGIREAKRFTRIALDAQVERLRSASEGMRHYERIAQQYYEDVVFADNGTRDG